MAVSGIVCATLFGLWQQVESVRESAVIPAVEAGTGVDLGRVILTPIRWETASDQEPGEHKLVLVANLENVTGRSENTPFDYPPKLPSLSAREMDFPPPELILSRDGEPLRQLQPRMSEEVRFIWTLSDERVGQTLTVTFFRQQFKLRDNLYGKSSWLLFSPVATMTIEPEAGT